MQFGEKLRKIRQDRNLTQPDLAEQLGIEQSWLSKLENDKSLPSSDLLDRVCQVFGLTLEQLLADLDPRYVRSQLSSLPEVRGLLQEKRYALVHSARRWLFAATVLVAVGATLLVTGYQHLLFNETRYIYYSEGIVYETEPEYLLDKQSESIWPLVIADIEEAQSSNELNNQYYRANIDRLHEIFLGKYKAELQQRRSDTVFRKEYVGGRYRVDVAVPENSTDIYGNAISAGSAAHRIYNDRGESREPKWQNNTLVVLGILLATFGLLLYIVEWRMARVTKLTVD